jgi:hypothetical protein
VTCFHEHVRTQPAPAVYMANGRQWAADRGLPAVAAVWWGWHLIFTTPNKEAHK